MSRALHHSRRANERGFALLGVLVILMLLLVVLLVSLDEAGDGLRDTGRARYRDMVTAAAQHGVGRALDQLSTMDAQSLVGIDETTFNIFRDWTVTPLIADVPYPITGPYAGDLAVRTGAAPGQRTRAASGEDVRSSYGYVLNVQLSVRTVRGNDTAAEQRVEVGVRVPQTFSHSN